MNFNTPKKTSYIIMDAATHDILLETLSSNAFVLYTIFLREIKWKPRRGNNPKQPIDRIGLFQCPPLKVNKICGMSRRTYWRSIKELIDNEIISKYHSGSINTDNNNKNCSTYCLKFYSE